MAQTKRLKELKAKIEDRLYSPYEALMLAKQTSNVGFDASLEVHALLGIDPKKGEQQVRTTVVMPHSSGKSKKVAAFVSENNEALAKEAGADLVGGENLIEEIAKSKKIDFDVAVATPDMMAKVAKIAKILGPKGLMPNPKTDTVGTDVKKMVGELKKGKLAFKNDNTANVHLVIGKVSQPDAELQANFNAFMEALTRAKPASSKGTYIKSLHITTSMGPSIKVATQ